MGGRFFTCSVGVLKVVKETWLDGKFGGFDGRWENKHVMDSSGRVFLDFDGDLFAVVLSQLRARFYNPNHKFKCGASRLSACQSLRGCSTSWTS